MPKFSGRRQRANKGAASAAAYESGQMAGVPKQSLSGYKPVMWPTVLPVKLTYTDYRVITAVGSQANYVYRLNSLNDPDFSGVGGQPAGFDQVKTLYGRYRVMAVKVEVQAAANAATGPGLLAIAPSDSSSLTAIAEDIAGLRYAKAASFTTSEVGKVTALWHIGELLGYSDQSMLANSNVEAAIGSNPAFQQYLNVNVETGNSATQQTMIMVRLTYYARMEVPIAVEDAVSKGRVAGCRLSQFAAGVTSNQPGVMGEPRALQSADLNPNGSKRQPPIANSEIKCSSRGAAAPSDQARPSERVERNQQCSPKCAGCDPSQRMIAGGPSWGDDTPQSR
jgi:hypothetical protein